MGMKTTVVEQFGVPVAVLESEVPVIFDVQSALDMIMTVQYDTGCTRVACNKEALAAEFFMLRTGLAGEVLQKFIIYQTKFAVYGDFSDYTRDSKALRDFIYESNNGKSVFFTATCEEAVERLAQAKE
ncbi:DUF4180 domain-containing protein [Christensenellaceae bacterium OttesenSCG-928-L17]|nr:DUF4180 domain-containing protein [Christensenellaceae bacterium OttesenSCG-928-L17]